MAHRSAALRSGTPDAAQANPSTPPDELRRDLRLIAEMIEPGVRVLDIGCGDGALLDYLARQKAVDARGIELSQSGVNACVRHGLSVIQGDADRDLDAFPAHAFDFVVWSGPCGRRASRAMCWKSSYGSAGARSSRFPI